MKKYYFTIAGIIVLLFAGSLVFGQQNEDPFAKLNYPIKELGNCKNKEDCQAYCDNPDNMAVCVDFADKNNLMPKEDVEMAKKMLSAGETSGPGGCKGATECQTYCDNISHIEECIAFAEKNNLMPAEQLAEGKKVAEAMKKGINPPKCKGKTECDTYCSLKENMEECITFAEAAGIMPAEQLTEAKKVLEAVKKGATPPSCKGKEECDAYCQTDEHFDECLTFAEAAGFVTAEDAAMAKKTGGKGPGGCRGKEQCDAFCHDPANSNECIDFAVKYGFMSQDEAQKAKQGMKMMQQGGPGGCKNEEECKTFCDNPNNAQECMNFAVQNGMMSQEDAQKAQQGVMMMQQGGPGGCKGEEECKNFCDNPDNTKECMNFAVQNGMMSQEDAQKAQQGVMMMQQGGPGGCKGEEECKNYCADASHLNECSNFAVQGGFMTPQEAQTMQQMQQQMQQQAQQVQQQIMQPMQGPFMPWGGEGGGNVPPSGQVPNGQMPMQPPSSEEIEKMKQQGIESGMQQMQQMMPGIQPGMQPGAGMQPGPTMPSGAGGMPPEGTMPGSSGGIAPQQMAPPQQQAPAQEQAPQMSPPPSSVPSPETPPPPQSLLEKFMANILNAAGKIGK